METRNPGDHLRIYRNVFTFNHWIRLFVNNLFYFNTLLT
jgi:hypothetical protein